MQNDAIAAALRAARDDMLRAFPPVWTMEGADKCAAAAIEAFLRALPDSDVCTQSVFNRRWADGQPMTLHNLAAAVARAQGGE